jgi:predicted alpha/beta superfamily hydrolase
MALNALQIDFHSAIRDRGYRLLVPIPARPAPAQGYPVVWLIDGNLHFGITVDTMHIQACWPDVRDAVIVGIGYPTDRVTEALGLSTGNSNALFKPDRPWVNPTPPHGSGLAHPSTA